MTGWLSRSLCSFSIRNFLTIPFRKIYVYFFSPIFIVSYLIGFLLGILSDYGDYTKGNSWDDLILSCLCLWYDTMVCAYALYTILLSFELTVDEDLSLTKSILKIMLLLFFVFLINDEYRFSFTFLLSTLNELDRFPQSSISSVLYVSNKDYLWSVWQCEFIFIIAEWFLLIWG